MRIDRFAERIKIQINEEEYKKWLVQTGSKPPKLSSDQNLAQEVAAKVRFYGDPFPSLLVPPPSPAWAYFLLRL